MAGIIISAGLVAFLIKSKLKKEWPFDVRD